MVSLLRKGSECLGGVSGEWFATYKPNVTACRQAYVRFLYIRFLCFLRWRHCSRCFLWRASNSVMATPPHSASLSACGLRCTVGGSLLLCLDTWCFLSSESPTGTTSVDYLFTHNSPLELRYTMMSCLFSLPLLCANTAPCVVCGAAAEVVMYMYCIVLCTALPIVTGVWEKCNCERVCSVMRT